MIILKRHYVLLVPVATLLFIFCTLYSARSSSGKPLLRNSVWPPTTSVGHTNEAHFGPQKDETPPLKDQDPNCAGFPHDRLADVQVVLRIGSTQPADQISSHINHITNCISNLIIISDREEKVGDKFLSYDIIADLPKVYWESIDNSNIFDTSELKSGLKAYARLHESEDIEKNKLTSRQGWLLDRFKFLPMVEYAYSASPQAKWFCFLEADTYIVWDTAFRLLDRYDPNEPWYMGSPAPGRDLENGEKTWFAYGGTGFILSRAAVQRFVQKDQVESIEDKTGEAINRTEVSTTARWADLVNIDCCGDSVLGFVLVNKGIVLSGLYPLFNPHALHSIPFGPSGKPYWCQPVLTMHKTWPNDVPMLSQYLRERSNERPVIYADLFDYLQLANVSERKSWQNSDWNGFEEDAASPVHKSAHACAEGCHGHAECFQWTYWQEASSWEWKQLSRSKCTYVRSIRLGTSKPDEETWMTKSTWTSGWDIEKISKWATDNVCTEVEWVEPSLERIY